MRGMPFRALLVFCAFALLSAGASASKRTAADFPLRVHVFSHSGNSFYHDRMLDSVQGQGRANLYENGQPHGFDFAYECSVRLMGSPGAETYLARWKKPGRELEILLPVLGGKPGDMNACDLKVTLKPDSAYFLHGGVIGEEPASDFKKWMDEHQYDPEHGKNEPVRPQQQPPAVPAAAQTAQSSKAAQ